MVLSEHPMNYLIKNNHIYSEITNTFFHYVGHKVEPSLLIINR